MLFLGIYPKEMKTASKRYLCTMFTAALFIIVKIRKQLKYLSTDEQIRRSTYIQ